MDVSDQLERLPEHHYKAILIDPPWTYATYSDKGKGRSPEQHYRCMTLDEIASLPIHRVAHKDCVLFLCVIDTHIPHALAVLKAWDFRFKTVGFYWGKTTRDGKPHIGPGHWTRANPEQTWVADHDLNQAFLATQGKPRREAKNVRRWIVSQRREHSRKPDELHEGIESLVAGPYLEIFGRESREGWTVVDDEADKFDRKWPDRSLLGLLL